MLTLWRHKFYIKLSMISKVSKGNLKISKASFSAIYYLFNAWSLKFFQECQHYKDTIFIKWTDFDQNLYEYKYHEDSIFSKIIYNLSLLCYGEVLWFVYFKTVWPNYNWQQFLWTTFVLFLCFSHLCIFVKIDALY